MRESSIDDMELGNLLFGNSRGLYVVEPREEYQDVFVKFLDAIGLDFYGSDDRGTGFENDTFVVRPYYWGDDDTIAELPNFVYKPMGLEICWYKYPMRDAYSNMDISTVEFAEILKNCLVSVFS